MIVLIQISVIIKDGKHTWISTPQPEANDDEVSGTNQIQLTEKISCKRESKACEIEI